MQQLMRQQAAAAAAAATCSGPPVVPAVLRQVCRQLSWLHAQQGTAACLQQATVAGSSLLTPQQCQQQHGQRNLRQHWPPPWQRLLPECQFQQQQQQPGSLPAAPWPSQVLQGHLCMQRPGGISSSSSRGNQHYRGSGALSQARRLCTTSREAHSSLRKEYILDFVHTHDPRSFLGVRVSPCQAAAAGGQPAQAAAAATSIQPAGTNGRPAATAAAAASTAAAAATAAGTPHPGQSPRGKVVAVAMSGGVDSAVSALLLQAQGYHLFGVFMHNWDAADEAGAGTPTCTAAEDLADAQAACRALGIPLFEADFVSRYWNEVFEAFLQGLSAGLTPNPDLACNSHIKFGALLQFARAKGADVLATGHYARLAWAPATGQQQKPAGQHQQPPAHPHNGPAAAATAAAEAAQDVVPGWRPVLLTGADPSKDQTYFLAGLTHTQLAQAMFPVGHLTKAQVRDIAAAAGLPQASKRSSAGICFIGRRSFGQFLEAYLPPQPGTYVDADTGAVLGPCSNMLAVTVGQKALGLGGQKTRGYVVGKCLQQGLVYVAAGPEHPALYSTRVLLRGPSWVSGQPPAELTVGAVAAAAAAAGGGGGGGGGSDGGSAASVITLQQHSTAAAAGAAAGVLHCQYQARYRQAAAACSIRALSAAEAAGFRHSRFCQVPTRCLDSSSTSSEWSKPRGATSAAAVGAAAAGTVEGVAQLGVAGSDDSSSQYLLAELQVPLRGVAPGQMFVLYHGEEVLGAATIVAHGPTLAEEQD